MATMITLPTGKAFQLPAYVRVVTNRHGSERLQFQRERGAPKCYMNSTPGTRDFEREYNALMLGLNPDTLVSLTQVETKSEKHLDQYDDSVGALAAAYFQGHDFVRMHPDSQMKVRRLINNLLATEPLFQGKPRRFASWPCDLVNPTIIISVRSLLQPVRPTKDPLARHFRDQHVQFFRAVWTWGLQHWTRHSDDTVIHLLRTANPCARLKPLQEGEGEGWSTMTDQEADKFLAHHPLDSMAHLSMAILRYTMVRRGDAAMLGKAHLQMVDGVLHLQWTEEKRKGRAPKDRSLPVSPKLEAVLAAHPEAMKRDTFIIGAQGGQLTAAAFGELFKEWCIEAGLPHCSCHSVRKGVATSLAEKKASPHVIQAMGGWTNLRQVMRYTRAAKQRKLAAEAVALL